MDYVSSLAVSTYNLLRLLLRIVLTTQFSTGFFTPPGKCILENDGLDFIQIENCTRILLTENADSSLIGQSTLSTANLLLTDAFVLQYPVVHIIVRMGILNFYYLERNEWLLEVLDMYLVTTFVFSAHKHIIVIFYLT